MRLLLADDEQEFTRALAAILRHNNWSVDVVDNGNDAVEYARSGQYDGVLLDVMMPGKNGLQALRELREAGITVPVLLLTAKGQVEDRIEGLDAGADDYLPKPFDMGELLARVRAMTRRSPAFSPGVLQFADLALDRASFLLTGPGDSLRLSGKEYQMMEMLLANPGRYISTEQFMERVWGLDSDAEINVVWVYISTLRKRLGAVGSRVELKAARRVGYMLEDAYDS